MTDAGLHPIELPTDDERVLGYEIRGKVTEDAMKGFLARLESLRENGIGARLFVLATDIDGFELGVALEKMKHMGLIWKGIERYALLSDSSMYRSFASGFVNALTPMDLKAFELDQREEALAWLLSDDGENDGA